MAKHDLIFYENRSTPQVVPAGQSATSKKGYGKQTYRRPANAKEEEVIATGKWLRVDQKGNTPSSPDYTKTKYRPALLKKKAEYIPPYIQTTQKNPHYLQLQAPRVLTGAAIGGAVGLPFGTTPAITASALTGAAAYLRGKQILRNSGELYRTDIQYNPEYINKLAPGPKARTALAILPQSA